MSPDKILHKIQVQINELAPVLELFLDDTVQPSVSDCENLQKQLSTFQENLAVYKYNKQNKELSPSFKIHAKLSEKVENAIKEEMPLKKEIKEEPKQVAPEIPHTQPIRSKSPLIVGINDKFRFINELFSQNSSEYNIVLEQLNNLNTWNETEIYLNSLKNVYGWKDHTEVVKYFYALTKKRFD
jgi:hypothetical protein